jgi:cytochrome c peroxidase
LAVEEQAEVPLKHDNEMAMTEQRVEATLRSSPEYVRKPDLPPSSPTTPKPEPE